MNNIHRNILCDSENLLSITYVNILTHSLPYTLFLPPENIRKPYGCVFRGKRKGALGANGSITYKPFSRSLKENMHQGQERFIGEVWFDLINKSRKLAIRRSSRPEMFCKKGVLRNFTKFTRKKSLSLQNLVRPPIK